LLALDEKASEAATRRPRSLPGLHLMEKVHKAEKPVVLVTFRLSPAAKR
jgi:hypothetical protein